MGFFKRLDLARRNAIDAGATDDELAALMRALRKDPVLIDDLSDCFELPALRGGGHGPALACETRASDEVSHE
jgi:hypothetical protein